MKQDAMNEVSIISDMGQIAINMSEIVMDALDIVTGIFDKIYNTISNIWDWVKDLNPFDNDEPTGTGGGGSW